MAFLAIDTRESLSQYDRIFCEDDSDNLWASLLKEVAANKDNSLPSKNLLVLGDRESGKTTLLAKLQGNEDPKKGSGLEFGYIDVRDDDCEEQTNLNHAVLDGDVAHANLLKFALTEENYVDTTVLVCASMATPWSIIDQLNKWIGVLQDHIDTLKLTPDQVKEYRHEKMSNWDSYSEPGLDFSGFPSRYPGSGNPLGSPTHEQFSMTDLSPQEEKSLDLFDGVMSRNLGLDVVVVLTKTDTMSQLEAEQGLSDQHFDFIQQAVRKFCLIYGASLFFTSVKEDKNCDLLYKYLVHRNYNFPFNTPALVVERDALFIPSGWDSPGKISILLENLFKFRPDQNYNEVIKSPYLGKKQMHNKNIEVVAENEQDFLTRIAPFLLQESHQERPISSRLMHSPESVLKTPERRVMGSPGVHSALKRSEYGSGKTPNDGAISNFFHALLNKKTGAGQTQLPSLDSDLPDNDRNNFKITPEMQDKNQILKTQLSDGSDYVPGQTQIKNIIQSEIGKTQTQS